MNRWRLFISARFCGLRLTDILRANSILSQHTRVSYNFQSIILTLARLLRSLISTKVCGCGLQTGQLVSFSRYPNVYIINLGRAAPSIKFAEISPTIMSKGIWFKTLRDLTNAQNRLALALVGLRLAWKNLDTATGKILLPFTP